MKRALIYAGLLALAVFYLTPIYVLVVNSLKDFREVSLEAMWQPSDHPTLASFVRAWQGAPETGMRGLGQNFWNSVYLVVPGVFFSVFLGSLNGYVLSLWRFRGSETLFFLLLFGMFIPYQSILIPLVRTLQATGLYGTIPGLVLTHVVYGLPITTLIFRNYYAQLPKDLPEAAQIDGAGILGIYRHIVLPLSAPATVVAVIWQFTQIWNDFLFGVVITNRPTVQPITVALNNLAGSFIVEWNVQMAGALLAALPTLLVYVLMGRYFIQGLLAGSVKG
ncbi:carbohydrate ABC transporter permease [Marinithermus hydrothermalis]|uniref:ABC-type transporter, integral membrane subunit n=1 Tax=Marinithermus hydrothermalis (strain DSM 14884 / JCM 11576 / T1) TaxID=869210 RepID=F2NPV3_MARHT|nr:carbohydrate ABC transporter permease [Marinithermus hydrothermalis]AEB12879.1 ABC-type transporter, integral membrane subunit [Marinithermus hydrothermalis DSM 14884]